MRSRCMATSEIRKYPLRPSFLVAFRKIAKSDYYLRHFDVILTVHRR